MTGVEPEDDDTDEEARRDAVDVEQEETHRRVSFFESSSVIDAKLTDYAAWDEIEEADAAVCSSIWNIFAKTSTAAGFDARSQRQILASNALARRRAADGTVLAPPQHVGLDEDSEDEDEEFTEEPQLEWGDEVEDANGNARKAKVEMGREKGTDGLTDRQRAILEAWQAITREKGDDFKNEEIAKRAGIIGGSPTSRSANVSSVLRRLRALGMVDDAPATPKKSPTAISTPRTPRKPKPAPEATAIVVRREPRPKVAASSGLADMVAMRDKFLADAATLTAAIELMQAAS